MIRSAYTGPIRLGDWIKASNFLTTGIVLDERYVTRDIDFALFLGDPLLFFSHRCWAMSATIVDDVLDVSEERRMAVKDNLSVFWFVPFGIQ